MELTDSNRDAINKLIGEAVGAEIIKMCSGKPFGDSVPPSHCVEDGEFPSISCTYINDGGCWDKCRYKLVKYPNFCGDDAETLVAIKALAKKYYWEVKIKISHVCVFLVVKIRRPRCETVELFKQADSLAAALAEVMVFQEEIEPEHEGGDPYLTEPRLKPTLEAAIKEAERDSN